MAVDLSTRHELLSDLFRVPKAREEWERLELSARQVSFYREQGYLTGVRILSEPQVDELCRQLEPLLAPDHDGRELWYEYHTNEATHPSRVLFHALGAWRITPGFHDLLWNPRFTAAAASLLEGPVRFWHDQLFCKPAFHGGVVAWHQDYSYWTRTEPLAHLSCWIALDDSTRENGCIQYVPGSHRWDLLPITGLAGDMEAIRQVLSDQQWEALLRPVAIELKRGEAAFHHPLLVHGSRENGSPQRRRAAVINVFRDGVRSASDEPPLDGVPVVPAGEKMGGQFFPLLFDAAASP